LNLLNCPPRMTKGGAHTRSTQFARIKTIDYAFTMGAIVKSFFCDLGSSIYLVSAGRGGMGGNSQAQTQA
jgi:hypothetical protein